MDYKYKEVVTRKNIETDIKRLYFKKILPMPLVIAGTTYLTTDAYRLLTEHSGFWNTLSYILTVIPLALTIGMTIYLCYCYFAHSKNFTIKEDELREITRNRYGWPFDHKIYTLYLRFTKGFFNVGWQLQQYYKWSENYRMDGRQLLNSSLVGDNFYLITVGKRILCVYNKKMFELHSNNKH
ncbi:MAG: hypothetical protein E7525_04525 [Ruminococcaceae bacterium]|nr:hypothetical protein [Oscillospiraceae bacterium]